jgi:hypothetical protein
MGWRAADAPGITAPPSPAGLPAQFPALTDRSNCISSPAPGIHSGPRIHAMPRAWPETGRMKQARQEYLDALDAYLKAGISL